MKKKLTFRGPKTQILQHISLSRLEIASPKCRTAFESYCAPACDNQVLKTNKNERMMRKQAERQQVLGHTPV
jgi:hypothetical protein